MLFTFEVLLANEGSPVAKWLEHCTIKLSGSGSNPIRNCVWWMFP